MNKIILGILVICSTLSYAQKSEKNAILYFSNGIIVKSKVNFKSVNKNLDNLEYVNSDNQYVKIESKALDSLIIENVVKFKRFLYKDKSLLLRELVDANSSLYCSTGLDAEKFYYRIGKGELKELIYEDKINDDGTKSLNYGYIFQLNAEVKCQNTMINGRLIKYKEEDLKKQFIEFNNCSNTKVKFVEEEKPINFYVGLLIGVGIMKSKVENNFGIPKFYDNTKFQFDNSTILKSGITLELNLPNNNYNWSVLSEFLHTKFDLKGAHLVRETPELYYAYTANYSNIECFLGARYAYNLNSNSKIFIEGLFSMFTFNMGNNYFKVEEGTNGFVKEMDINNNSSGLFGLGYKYKNKLLVGIRFATTKNYLKNQKHYVQNNNEAFVYITYNIKLNKKQKHL